MDKEKLAKVIAEKIDGALNASEHPKKFFITENGRGVVDGGDLYNAALKDALEVMKVALVDIIAEVVPAGGKTATAKKADK